MLRSKTFFVCTVITGFIVGWFLNEELTYKRIINSYSVASIEDANRLRTALTELYLHALANAQTEEDVARVARAFTALQLSEEASRRR